MTLYKQVSSTYHISLFRKLQKDFSLENIASDL